MVSGLQNVVPRPRWGRNLTITDTTNIKNVKFIPLPGLGTQFCRSLAIQEFGGFSKRRQHNKNIFVALATLYFQFM